MKRKVNKVGQNTLTVSLPSKWAKLNGVKVGDEIDVIEKDCALIINSKKNILFKEINIKLTSDDYKFIKAIIRNLYFHGFEKINITYNSSNNYGSILKSINSLDGYETLNEKEKSCSIVNFSEIHYEKFDIFYNKMFNIVEYMQELFESLLNGKNEKPDGEIINNLNSKASKYACICRRILTRNNLMNKDKSIIKFTIIATIHMIIRNYYNCYNEILKYNNNKISLSVIKFNNSINTIFKDLKKLNTNQVSINNFSITEKREEILKKEFPKLLMKLSGIDTLVLHYLAEIVRFYGTIAPKMEIMNLFFE